ncbi:hypothetical protein [Tannerella forsythia]|uniref:Uncharacterized protein n=2 Tax=Tannerella forsythia TaxID=28112 RepID=A0A2A6E802_TANFO|nr:hypothetical protein [Tannerella forsythia]PDP43462.1 hypothetical protein CLI86_08300 [Tannerella forsythia]
MNIKMLFIDEKVIENVHFGYFQWLSIPNRAFKQAAYWRWAFFLVLNFNQGMKVEFCTSVDTKPFSSPIASTILAGVIFYLF